MSNTRDDIRVSKVWCQLWWFFIINNARILNNFEGFSDQVIIFLATIVSFEGNRLWRHRQKISIF